MKCAIIGVTGVIGQAFLTLLESSHLIDDVYCIASGQSTQKQCMFRGESRPIHTWDAVDWSEVDVCFSAVDAALAQTILPKCVQKCALVIDNSSAYRQDDKVPLIIPELNFSSWQRLGQPTLIANPNCTTVSVLMASASVQKLWGIRRMDVATYQAISGAGRAPLQEFISGFKHDQPWSKEAKLLDVTASIDEVDAQGYTKEELKMHYEGRKILENPEMVISATSVRVPVHTGHGAAVSIEAEKDIDVALLCKHLKQQEGVVWMPETVAKPLEHAMHSNSVYVSRVRPDLFCKRRVHMWVVSDNILRGGAYNAFKIFEAWHASTHAHSDTKAKSYAACV